MYYIILTNFRLTELIVDGKTSVVFVDWSPSSVREINCELFANELVVKLQPLIEMRSTGGIRSLSFAAQGIAASILNEFFKKYPKPRTEDKFQNFIGKSVSNPV